MQLNVNAVLSVFLSALTGLGLVISINSLLMEYLKWRRRRQLRPANQQTGTRSWPQLQQQLYDSNYHQQHEQRLEQERHQPHSQQQAIENQNMESLESADQEGTTILRQQLTEVPKVSTYSGLRK